MPKKATTPKAASDQKAMAYHEAGHAVVCFRLLRPPKFATIVHDKESLCQVLTREASNFHPDKDDLSRARALMEDMMLTQLAGIAAESKFRGSRNWKFVGSDVDALSNLTHWILPRDDRVIDAYQKYLMAKIDGLIGAPVIWSEVSLVAQSLLKHKTLDEDQIGQTIEAGEWRGMKLALAQVKRDKAKWEAQQKEKRKHQPN